ncbi:hypothetical protein BSK50_30285 [Paenibacillus odorifer]|nr:hypothetical protein BSK50_30285 [Paenibacillus odorifer]
MQPTYYSGYEREQFDGYASDGFDELLTLSPEAYDVVIEGLYKRVIVQQTSKDNVLQILSKKDDFKAGDVVRHNYIDHLVMLRPQYNQMYQKSKIEMCNINLKWVDGEGIVQSHPSVYYFNARSNFGVEEGKVMTLPDGRRQTVVQRNEHTVKLKRDKRFIIGGEAFKVIDVDYVSDEGLVNLNLQSSSDLNSSVDNLELEIANYYDSIANYKIVIGNGSFATISEDQTLQLNVSVTNNNILVTTSSIEFLVSDTEILNVDEHGLITPLKTGSTSITVKYKNVSATIGISVTESTTYAYTCEIVGLEEMKVGRTQAYSVKFYRNGVEYPDESIFSITGDDEVSTTKLATINVQDSIANTCTILAASTIGYVRLHVKNQNGLSTTSKKIKIKPLF